LPQLGEVINMNRQLSLILMGDNWTNRAIRVAVLAVALAFAIWAVIHFGNPALGGHGADGSTWVERG
jgi:hypothetical protein